MSIFSKKLKFLLESRKICLKELALHLHCSVSTVSNYQNGVHQPCIETIIKIAKFFNVTTDYLLGLSDSPLPPKEQPIVIYGKYTIGCFEEILGYLTKADRASIAHHIKLLEELRLPKHSR